MFLQRQIADGAPGSMRLVTSARHAAIASAPLSASARIRTPLPGNRTETGGGTLAFGCSFDGRWRFRRLGQRRSPRQGTRHDRDKGFRLPRWRRMRGPGRRRGRFDRRGACMSCRRRASKRIKIRRRSMTRRKTKAAAHLVQKRGCVRHGFGGNNEAVIAKNKRGGVRPQPLGNAFRQRQAWPPVGNEGIGNAAHQRRNDASASARTAWAMVLTQWTWTTIFCGRSAWTVVSIEGRRPLGSCPGAMNFCARSASG